MEGLSNVVVIVVVSSIIFIIYFNFKILQFVIQAINLYKKMVNRQDATLKILLDIRDNTKNFDNQIKPLEEENISPVSQDGDFICKNCKMGFPNKYKRCPECGEDFE